MVYNTIFVMKTMIRIALILFVLSVFYIESFSQKFKFSESERVFLDSLEDVIENPKELHDFLFKKCVVCDADGGYQLGFGLSSEFVDGDIGGIYFEGYFNKFRDSILGYNVYLSIYNLKPKTARQLERYNAWLILDSNENIYPITFGNTKFYRRPIETYSGKYTNEKIPEYLLEYMSFESGNDYGYFCGECKNSLTRNRSYFLLIEDSLDYEKTKLLLYSMNPASRLTATEFMYRNHDKWQIDDDVYDQIDSIFGVRDSMDRHFCIVQHVSVKDEVNRYVKYLKENPSYNEGWKQSMIDWKQKGYGYFTKPD